MCNKWITNNVQKVQQRIAFRLCYGQTYYSLFMEAQCVESIGEFFFADAFVRLI